MILFYTLLQQLTGSIRIRSKLTTTAIFYKQIVGNCFRVAFDTLLVAMVYRVYLKVHQPQARK